MPQSEDRAGEATRIKRKKRLKRFIKSFKLISATIYISTSWKSFVKALNLILFKAVHKFCSAQQQNAFRLRYNALNKTRKVIQMCAEGGLKERGEKKRFCIINQNILPWKIAFAFASFRRSFPPIASLALPSVVRSSHEISCAINYGSW